ncbi:GNAT family N-acetyltransferase [Microbacterium sp. ZW T5_56]|uniref:GNAT family N-acetyltransferase n=1 Tax=Microbacterium sp. ZW T5_56 TaxID=3378081 RepID=UPI003852347E
MTDLTFRHAALADEPELFALWAAAFTPPLAPDQWLLDADRHRRTQVAVLDGQVVGSVYGMPKMLHEDNRIASVHAIGSVAVAPSARGRGVAARMVERSLDDARAAGREWALLFTDTPGVYRSSGFEQLPMRRVRSGAWSASVSAAADVVSAPTDEDGLRAVDAVYRASRTGRVSLAPSRGDLDFRAAAYRLSGTTLHRVDNAYAIEHVEDGLGVIDELACTLGHSADEALSAVAGSWAAAGVTSCSIAIPALPELDDVIARFAPAAIDEADTTAMVRALTREPSLTHPRHFGAADYF